MIDVRFSEKVAQLKAIFTGQDPDAMKQIEAWEKRIRELSAISSFMENEAAQMILQSLKDRVKEHMRYRLKKGLSEQDRRLSEAKEEEVRWMLDLFRPSYESELDSLEKILDEELA